MQEGPWSRKVLGKYLLLQLPGWIIVGLGLLIARRWADIPWWLYGAILGGWVVMDFLLYPFVWRAYAEGGLSRKCPSRGCKGFVVRDLSPSGYIEVDGELWKAEPDDTRKVIRRGEWVTVREVRGLTLIVDPLTAE